MLKASKNNRSSSEASQLCKIQVIIERTLYSKGFVSNLRYIFNSYIFINSYRFSYKFAFILFLSFLTNQKQESGFQQVGGLVTRNIPAFRL